MPVFILLPQVPCLFKWSKFPKATCSSSQEGFCMQGSWWWSHNGCRAKYVPPDQWDCPAGRAVNQGFEWAACLILFFFFKKKICYFYITYWLLSIHFVLYLKWLWLPFHLRIFWFSILNVTAKLSLTVRRMNMQSPVEELALTDILCLLVVSSKPYLVSLFRPQG